VTLSALLDMIVLQGVGNGLIGEGFLCLVAYKDYSDLWLYQDCIIIRFERRDPSSCMLCMRLSYIAQSVLALYTVASI